jgi:hypothetical protein
MFGGSDVLFENEALLKPEKVLLVTDWAILLDGACGRLILRVCICSSDARFAGLSKGEGALKTREMGGEEELAAGLDFSIASCFVSELEGAVALREPKKLKPPKMLRFFCGGSMMVKNVDRSVVRS